MHSELEVAQRPCSLNNAIDLWDDVLILIRRKKRGHEIFTKIQQKYNILGGWSQRSSGYCT